MKYPLSCIEPLEARIAPAVIFVTTLKDITSPAHDTGSLRDAIFLANESVGVPDEIVFQKADGKPLKGAIKLDSDLPEITDSLTISGPVADKANGVTINGNKHAIFTIIDGDVTLKDLTVKNGQAEVGAGIFIDNAGGTTSLTGVAIVGNRAISNTTAMGGGIAILDGTVAISNSLISGNSAIGLDQKELAAPGGSAFGAGIYNNGILTITDSIIAGNTAKGGKAKVLSGFEGGSAIGGGVFGDTDTSDITIENTLISRNKALGGAGAAAAAKTSESGGDGGEGSGGGVANAEGKLEIIGSIISGNSGKGGAGGKGGSGEDFEDGGDGGRGGVSNGGGVSSFFGDSELTIHDSQILKNVATGGKGGKGGAAGFGGDSFAGFSRGIGVATGGGVYSDTLLTISQALIVGNSTRFGGGVGVDPGADATIEDSTIASNKASVSGGGIDGFESSIVLVNSTVAKNSAPAGGGINVDIGALTVLNSTIAQNTAKTAGGGIYTDTSDLVEIVSTIIAGNKAKTDADFAYDLFEGGSGAEVSFSLIQKVTDGTVLDASSQNNLLNVDPKLLKLGKNGGSTLTFLLAADSPAIDNGSNPEGLANDQRGTGFIRTKGAATDIGAVEVA